MLGLNVFQKQKVLINKLHLLETHKTLLLGRKINTSKCLLMDKAGPSHRPNKIDKYLLVWMKKYPSVAAVPNFVSPEMMEKVRNKSRIKINIITCFVVAFVCVGMIYSGKQAAKKGESVRKMNEDWHKEENAKAKN